MSIASRNILSIEQYNDAESKALVGLSIPHIMAFRPVAFQLGGWPHQVRHEAELRRYADHNFEAEVPGLFEPDAMFAPIGYHNAFTIDEQELINQVRDRVAWLTETWLGRRIRPVTNLLVQTGPFRMMNQLAAAYGRKHLGVFEVGPGAGYLGALLAQTGHRYLSYDVAQSLYLWQNRLLQAVGGEDFVELALPENDKNANEILRTARLVHLPWWMYVHFLDASPVRVDVVYSNSNLSEMTNLSLRHVLQISRHMLAESEIGLFCFFSKGAQSQTPPEAIDQEFKNFGYYKALEFPFRAFTLTQRQAERISAAFKQDLSRSRYNPSGRTTVVRAHEIMRLRRNEAPLDTRLTEWAHNWKPPFED